MALFLVVGAAELRLNNSFIDGNCISLPFQRETLMRDAVLNLDLNRSSLVDISIPGLTEPNSLRLVLHPGVFLCLADEFTYHLVIGVEICLGFDSCLWSWFVSVVKICLWFVSVVRV